MANTSAPRTSSPGTLSYNGWFRNEVDDTLDLYKDGVKISAYSAASEAITGAITASTTVTGGTGLVATTGDIKCTAGNLRLGAIEAFTGGGATEPTSAVVCKQGTAPSGAITTSASFQSSDTVVTKCIADGTVDNIET